jgi:Putative zinc-finger
MGSDCRYLDSTDGYSHGELAGDELAEFERHLNTCDICRTEVESIRRLKEGLNRSFESRLDQRFNYSIINELREKKKAGTGGEIRIALEDIVVSLATLLVIVLIAIQLLHKPRISSVEMAGTLTKIEKSSMEQTKLSNDQVLELVVRSK